MNAPRSGIWLQGDYATRERMTRDASLTSLVRACIAVARSTGQSVSAGEIIRKNWRQDDTAELIVRASTSPTTLISATALAQTVVADLITATAPGSAGATLLDAGLQFSFGRSAYVSVPSFVRIG
jgi:hypothetical protein